VRIDHKSRSKYFRQVWWALNSPSPISHPLEVGYFLNEEHQSSFCGALIEQDNLGNISAHFEAMPFLRLGKYFESLIHYAIELDSMYGLILKNHPIYHGKITTGEIDLIIKKPNTQVLEHWEIALKFYLQHGPNDPNELIGPGGNDTLASKLQKLESKQLPLGQHLSVIEEVGSTPTSKLFLKGMFFHHLDSALKLDNAKPDAHAGWWIYQSELEKLESLNVDGWGILQKSEWIGTSIREEAPEFNLSRLIANLANSEELINRGICIAGYQQRSDRFIESTRGFIIQDNV
jgi:hypothetical protein